MESEKVKEIKETLKRCGSGKDGCCWGCSLQDTQNIAKCTTVLCDKALTLINELESENERLILQYERVKADSEMNCLDLKDRIAELEKEKKDYYDRFNNLQTYIDNHEEIWKGNTKNALKQFAERLKDSGEIKALLEMETMPKVFKHIHDEIVKRIDETLKEEL